MNPDQNCISALPVPSPCPSGEDQSVPIKGNVFKNWDQTSDYNWLTGPSEEAVRSAIIEQGGRNILVTGSNCQLQARLILS